MSATVFAAALALAGSARAHDMMSGTFSEEYTETVYSLEQWGAHCGEAPRSIGRHKRKLVFEVEDRGVDLLFKLPSGKSFSSVGCQTSNPAVKPKERTVKDKLYLTSCATPETSKSYESGLYSFRILSADRIEYRETTRFSRNVAGALCVYSRRIRRMYQREKNRPKPPETAKVEPVSTVKVSVAKDDPCLKPGPAVSLALAPGHAEVKAGAEFCPKVEAKDARGCPVSGAGLSWGKGEQPAGVKLTIGGCLKIDKHAKPGPRRVALAFGRARAILTIVIKGQPVVHPAGHRHTQEPREIDAGLVIAKASDEQPAAAVDAGVAGAGVVDAGVASPADTAPEAKPDRAIAQPAEAPGEPPAPPGLPNWMPPALIGGGALVVFVILAIVSIRRKRRHRRAGSPPAAPSGKDYHAEQTLPEPLVPLPAKPEPEKIEPAEPARAATTSADKPDKIFCTTCGKAIPAEARFCPYDRTPIYKPSSPTLASAPVCPTCKRLLPMGAKFCPYDKTKLG